MTVDEIRGNIRDVARSAWDLDDDEISNFRGTLRSTSSGLGVSDAFEECTQERNFRSCLIEWAAENELDDAFEGDWEDNAPSGLLDNLRDIGDAWGPEEVQQARDIALNADLDRLNRMCSRGQIDDVQDELDMDAVDDLGGPNNITNFQECVEAVALAQDLSSTLKDAWGTNGG